MPLAKGSSVETISRNIAELVRAGHARPQAEAIAERVARDCTAQDMSPADWAGLEHGLTKFFSEERREPEHVGDAEFSESDHPRDENGRFKRESAEQDEADKGNAKREKMPAGVFLEPGARKYPVKEQRDGAWRFSRNLLLAAAREARMHGHADLAARADRIREGMAQDGLAFDRAPGNRTKTEDGHLKVKLSNISKSNVCPYIGREIPNWEELGLDPQRVYKLFRHPTELKKAAPTFNEVPILLIHRRSIASDHPRQVTVGTTGSNTRFDPPYLKTSLSIWDGEGVNAVESEDQNELSCGYRYDADMTPGTHDGEDYDGVMRNIRGNHVALVTEGRAGNDVVVGDSMETVSMPKIRLSRAGAAALGAINAIVQPKMARDQKSRLAPAFVGVTAANFDARRAGIKMALDGALKRPGLFASDAEAGEVIKAAGKLVDMFDPGQEEGMDDDPDPDMAGMDKEWGEDDEAAYQEMLKRRPKDQAEDEDEDEETPEQKKKREASEKKNAMDDEKVTKQAMDAAIRLTRQQTISETMHTMNEIAQAKEAVRPLVGSIAIAMDSAEAVYSAALKSAGQDVTGVNLAGMKQMTALVIQTRNAAGGTSPVQQMASDSASFSEMDDFRKQHGLTFEPVKRAIGSGR